MPQAKKNSQTSAKNQVTAEAQSAEKSTPDNPNPEHFESTPEDEEEPSEIDSFVLDEQETGELSEDDSRLGDEDDLEEDSEESEDDEDELEEEDEVDLHLQHDQRFLLRKDSNSESVAGAISGAIPVGAASALETEEIFPPVDPETQAKLEALFETAGIGKLAGETKQFTDPEVLKRLTSSVSCALDEAAAALTRMRSDPPTDGKTLVEACNEGDFSKVRKLLDEGRVSVHDTTEEGESLLSLACSAGYYELAQVLLAMRANVEDRGMKGDCTPLMEASSSGHLEIVKLLLSHGADVNAQSSSGNTPLMYACASGHAEVVRSLLEAGANVEDHNENGHTPLMEAASAGHVEVAKILLEFGAGINTHSNEFKESALTLACYKGHLEMVRFLLEAGADQEHKTDEMHTALMEASMDGHVEVAKLLLDSGAQVNMPADSFESPLTLAACGGHVELAMLLLERGANIEEVNDEGYTPLMEAAREGHEEMVALLLSQGADINAQTEETQETALTLACCGGFLDVADFLIKAGADLELGASSPLMEASQEGHLELVKYLLEARAEVNAQTSTGDTALSFACERGHTDVADLLLKWGSDLEHQSEGGRTPLMKAVRAGHYCTAKFLIGKGANVNKATTNNDHTPLSLACAGGHLTIVELLLQNKADPYHKLKDNSTMLIEAAKGGHTNVVSVLIDYNPTTLTGGPAEVVPAATALPAEEQQQLQAADTTTTTTTTGDQPITTRFPAEGHEAGQDQAAAVAAAVTSSSQTTSSTTASAAAAAAAATSMPNKSNSSLKSVLRKTRMIANTTTTSPVAATATGGGGPSSGSSSPKDGKSKEAGYDFIEGSGFVIEGLEDKGLDAKSYIQQMLRRTDGSSREEQLIQKEQILAELQRVERELQEKAHAQMMLSSGGENADQIRATEMLEDMVHMSLNSAAASTATGSSLARNVTNLANLPPSERPKAKPSRKIVNNQQNNNSAANAGDKGKKSQLQAALQQHSQQLAQLQQLQQLNQQLQQQVLQQRQLKQQNQATLAALQQNALANQQQLAKLQHDVAQLQSLEQHILAQQNSSQNQQHQLQQKVQQILQQKQQLQQQIKQFQQQVEQQLAYTQHATPSSTPPPPPSTSSASVEPSSGTSQSSSSSATTTTTNNEATSTTTTTTNNTTTTKKTTTKRGNKDLEAKLPTSAAYELVQASQALQAVQALQHLDPAALSGAEAEIEPLTQDPTLLQNTLSQIPIPNLPETIHLQLPPFEQALTYGYKDGLQASPDLARTIQVQQAEWDGYDNNFHPAAPALQFGPFAPQFAAQAAGSVQNFTLQVSQADGSTSTQPQVTSMGHQLLLQSQFPFGQHVDANGQINFAGADMAGSSYLPNEAVFLPASMGGAETFTQPDLPPLTEPKTNKPNLNNKAKGKKSKQPLPPVVNNAQSSTVEGVVANNTVQPADPSSDILQFQPVVDPASVSGSMQPLETYEAYTAAVASAAVDLDSETDSNHDTALTLACAGGHEELVTLLINRGANIEHRDKKGFTPLILAATAGHDKVCEILLDHNADIEAQSERTKDTPLSLACSGGRFEVVEVLLRRGANKEHRNVSDYTPLALAASGGYVNIIKLLLATGAEINSRTGSKLGISPLMLAAMNGHTASVKLLLDMGSDINAQIETNRNTALTLACFQGRHEVVSLLLDRKANVEHRAKTGLTPLMEAASGGFVDVGRVLLDKGADVNAPPVPSSRDTALTIAADKGHYRFVELLLSRGAQVDVRNKKGNSSLWLAANGGHLDVVQLLHSAGADIDSQDNRKLSCLMAAFRKGHSKVVKWMVKHVCQFPSDAELTRYIATVSDKDLLKKCHTCMEIIRVAKEKQAAEAAKNASSLLEELDREKNMEESKKAAAARKREKKKRKKMEKLAEKGLLPTEEENKENNVDDNNLDDTDTDDKEKTPELMINHLHQDSGIEVNSQSSESSSQATVAVNKTSNSSSNSSNSGNSSTLSSNNTRLIEAEQNPPNIKEESNINIQTNKKTIAKAAKKNKKNKQNMESTSLSQQSTTSNSIEASRDKKDNINGSEQAALKLAASAAERLGAAAAIPGSMPNYLTTNPVTTTSVSVFPSSSAPISSTPSNTAVASTPTAATSATNNNNNNNKKSRTNKQTSPSTSGPANKNNKKVPGSSGSGVPTSTASGGTVPAAAGPVPDAGWKEVVRKSKKVIVPANAISRVIGRGGCNINAIREMSGAHIEVEKLQGKVSQQTERTILIKGSAEATRQANTWIQQIINSPDKDMTDILGKNYLSTKAALQTTIQSTVIVNSKVSSGKVTPVLPNQIPSMTIITGSSSNNALPKKAVTTVTSSNTGTKVSTTLVKPKPSSTFASVASGESFGMIQTGGTHPGSLMKVQKAKSPDNMLTSSAMDEPFGTFTVEASNKVNVVEQQQQQQTVAAVATAKANLDNKDYSPFKSFGGWQDDKNNFASAAIGQTATGSGVVSSNENDLAAKAPGYRISPSGGPLFPSAASGWANVSVAATSLSVASNNPLTSTSNMSSGSSIMTSSGLYSMDNRSNSAPGSPILPPIGPPNPGANMVSKMQNANNTSPGSEPDYRTGSSLSSGIGLSPGSSNPMAGGGGPVGVVPGSGRSLTPDNDMSSMSKSMANAMQDKNDLFVGGTSGLNRPASSGSANNAGAFMVNPENLLSAAAQMASVGMFNADLDYLAVQAPPSRPVDFHRYNVQPPTSKLNPNAPDFMRPPMTATSSSVASSAIRSPMLNKNNNSFSNTRFNNSNNLPTILTNQGINAYLQTQNNSFDWSAIDANLLSGRSIKEINELITGSAVGHHHGGTSGGTLPQQQPQQVAPPPQQPPPQITQPPPPPQQQQAPYGHYYNEPKLSRPIGSERLSKPSNSPWDLSGLYDSLGTADLTGYLSGTGTSGGGVGGVTSGGSSGMGPPTFDSTYNGLPPSQQDYLSPVIGMSPNVTPNKSDYGDYSMMPPGVGVGNSAGKNKMQGYLDPPPMGPGPVGMAGRGDPASVRRNMNQSWGKKWGDE